MLSRVEKNAQERLKNLKKCFFFVLNKSQSVTHVSICIFQGLFKNKVFRSVALVTKSNELFKIFLQTRLFSALYSTL